MASSYALKALAEAESTEKDPECYLTYEEFTPAILAEISLKLDTVISLLAELTISNKKLVTTANQ